MFARLKLSAISGFILPILCTKGQNKGKFCYKGDIPKCLFLTFLNPGSSTIRSFQRNEFCVVNRFLVCLSETQYLHAEIYQNFKI